MASKLSCYLLFSSLLRLRPSENKKNSLNMEDDWKHSAFILNTVHCCRYVYVQVHPLDDFTVFNETRHNFTRGGTLLHFTVFVLVFIVSVLVVYTEALRKSLNQHSIFFPSFF